MNETELRRRAEDQLETRLKRGGTVENREAWLQAVMRALRNETREPTDSAQTANIKRAEAQREPLPAPATEQQIAASKPWLAEMRNKLGRPSK